MNDSFPADHQPKLRQNVVEPLTIAGVIVVLVISGVVALRNIHELQENRLLVRHTNQVLSALREVESSAMNAESAQRGYLITSNDAYLKPYTDAMMHANESLDLFAQLTSDDPAQHRAGEKLRKLVNDRLDELEFVRSTQDRDGAEEAYLAVATDVGKRTMKRINDQADQMRQDIADLLSAREQLANRS